MKSYIYCMKFKGGILVLFVLALLTACRHKNNSGAMQHPSTKKSLERTLKKLKDSIDKLVSSVDSGKIIVLVKLPNSSQLVRVINEKFPDDVEITYNIFRNQEGHIVFAGQAPESESGDWDIEYQSYFDKNGKLFAFERIAGFFNSECTKDDDAAHETLVKYYSNGKLIDSTYTLTDSKKRPLVKSKCVFNYDYPYTIIFDWDAYKKANKINVL